MYGYSTPLQDSPQSGCELCQSWLQMVSRSEFLLPCPFHLYASLQKAKVGASVDISDCAKPACNNHRTFLVLYLVVCDCLKRNRGEVRQLETSQL